MRPKIYGLTGGIGVGKSVVAELFRVHGTPVLDADLISRELMVKGEPLFDEVLKLFGDQVESHGKLDRTLIRKLIFNNSELKEKLEKIAHPRIMERAFSLAEDFYKRGERVVLLEAALLVESKLNKKLDGLIMVTALPHQQKTRASKRDDVTEEEINLIIKAQLSDKEKLKYADFVIDNSGTIAETEVQVKEVSKKLKNLFPAHEK